MKRINHKLVAIFLIIFIFLPFWGYLAFSKKNGVSGLTNMNSKSCGECHSSNPGPNVIISLQSDSNLNNIPPQTRIKFTLTANLPNAKVSGIDVAVKNQVNGTQNVGTLTPETNSGLKILNGEITHSSPINCSNSQITYNFFWTAPQTEGSYFLQGAVLMGNGNGKEDSGDLWNWLQPVELKVKTTSNVENNGESKNKSILFFDNTKGKFSLLLPAEQLNKIDLFKVVDLHGKEITTLNYIGNNSLPQQFEALQDLLPNGIYFVVIKTGNKTYFEEFFVEK